MALDRGDIELLKGAKEKGLTIEQMIESAEQMLALNELKESLKNIGNQLSFRFSNIVDENIEEIIKIESDEDKLKYIVFGAYEAYKNDIAQMQKEQEMIEEQSRQQQESEV